MTPSAHHVQTLGVATEICSNKAVAKGNERNRYDGVLKPKLMMDCDHITRFLKFSQRTFLVVDCESQWMCCVSCTVHRPWIYCLCSQNHLLSLLCGLHMHPKDVRSRCFQKVGGDASRLDLPISTAFGNCMDCCEMQLYCFGICMHNIFGSNRQHICNRRSTDSE